MGKGGVGLKSGNFADLWSIPSPIQCGLPIDMSTGAVLAVLGGRADDLQKNTISNDDDAMGQDDE